MTPNRDRGIIDTPSNHSVDETVEKLKGILQAKGVTLFALVDHSGEAEKVGMKMRPTKLLIFGSPKAGNFQSSVEKVCNSLDSHRLQVVSRHCCGLEQP